MDAATSRRSTSSRPRRSPSAATRRSRANSASATAGGPCGCTSRSWSRSAPAPARPPTATLAAANGTYDFFIPILFADMDMIRPEDTIFDSSRYKSLDLEIQLGTVADLFSTPVKSSIVVTLDIDVERTYGALHPDAKPHWFISFDHRAPQDPSVNPNVELEKTNDLSFKRLYLWTGDTGIAGQPWTGNANDTYPVKTNIQDQERFIQKDRKHAVVQAQNKTDAFLETALAGIEVYDFVKD